MRKIFTCLSLITALFTVKAQAPFWNENFGTGCNSGQFANNLNPSGLGTWSVVSTGTNGSYANDWFISADEAGMGLGNCGGDCNGSNNRTLHVGLNFTLIPLVDQGATYLAGAGSETNKRVMSPVINCTGQSSIGLSFLYLAKGVPGSDYFEVQYSANGGGTWSVIATPPPTPSAVCNPQGQWTSYSVVLPASANNNNNVKVGFRWQNIDPTGADPSVAIDDVKLTSLVAQFAPSFTLTTPVCSGNTNTLTANTGTFAVSGYTWSATPAGPTFGSPNSSVTTINYPSQGTFSITLTATSGTTTANSTQTVLVNPTPQLTPSMSASSICPTQIATLTVSGAANYTWNPGAQTGSNIVVSPTVTTTYTIIGLTGNCSNTAVKTLSVNSTLNLTMAASPATICSGSSSTLSVNGAANYTWNPGSLAGSTVAVSPSVTTIYTVNGTQSGCSGTATLNLIVVQCTSVFENGKEISSYVIFPNPVKEELMIRFNSNEPKDLKIQVLDMNGKMVLSGDYSEVKKNGLNTSSLSSGVYMLKLYNAGGESSTRFVKE